MLHESLLSIRYFADPAVIEIRNILRTLNKCYVKESCMF